MFKYLNTLDGHTTFFRFFSQTCVLYKNTIGLKLRQPKKYVLIIRDSILYSRDTIPPAYYYYAQYSSIFFGEENGWKVKKKITPTSITKQYEPWANLLFRVRIVLRGFIYAYYFFTLSSCPCRSSYVRRVSYWFLSLLHTLFLSSYPSYDDNDNSLKNSFFSFLSTAGHIQNSPRVLPENSYRRHNTSISGVCNK